MQIREIHIDGFGIFADKRITGLSAGINVIYGPNEFGKTTLLEFIRRIMFGVSKGKKPGDFNAYPALRGANYGGKLVCEMANGDPLVIARAGAGFGGKLWVSTRRGEQEGQAALDACIGNASADIYQNIYAFSIDELHNFRSLEGEEIKNRIYGAGLGLKNVSLAKIEGDLQARAEKIFKPRGAKNIRMNDLLNETAALAKRIEEIQKHLGQFTELSAQLNRLNQERKELKTGTQALEARRRALEVRLDLYPVYVELADAEERLAGLDEVAGFPENGHPRFIGLRSDIEHRARQCEEEKQAIEKLKADLQTITVNEALLAQENNVQSLRQLTEKARAAIHDKIAVQRERDVLHDQIQAEIARLGKEWDEALLEQTDFPLAEKNQIDSYHATLVSSQQNVNNAKAKLDLHREQKAAEPSAGPELPAWLKPAALALMGSGAAGAAWGAVSREFVLIFFSLLVSAMGFALYRFAVSRGKPAAATEDRLEITLRDRYAEEKKESERIYEEWKSWLRERRLDPMLTPMATQKAIGAIQQIKSMIVHRNGLDGRLQRMTESEKATTDLIDKILPALPGAIRKTDIGATIAFIGHGFDESKRNKEKRAYLEYQIKGLADKIEKLEQHIRTAREALDKLIESAGARDEDDFERLHRIVAERRALEEIRDDKRGFIQTRVGRGEKYGEFLATLAPPASPEQFQHELGDVLSQLEELGKNKDRMNQVIGELRGRIGQLSSNNELILKQSELESKKQQMKAAAQEWAVDRIALVMLDRAKRKYEQERQPEVIKAAEDIFSRITDHKYKRIFKPIDSDEIRIAGNGAEKSRGVVEMSRGTREQLYLAMRFGLIQEYETRAEPLPVVMDDVFVNFDDDRGARVVAILESIARSRQIIVLSCHRHALEVYARHGATQIVV